MFAYLLYAGMPACPLPPMEEIVSPPEVVQGVWKVASGGLPPMLPPGPVLQNSVIFPGEFPPLEVFGFTDPLEVFTLCFGVPCLAEVNT